MSAPFFSEALGPLYREHPLVLVDVGARLGLQRPWKEIEPHLRVVGFEPDTRSFEGLKATELPSRTNLNVGLYRDRARKPLYLTRTAGGSSILEPNSELLAAFPNPERFDVLKQSEIEVDTLDRQLVTHGVDDVDFIKVDTQGSELPVLEGAADTLTRLAFGVEVEVEFVPLYRNAALFPDVHSFMLGRGFHLVDLRPIYWKRQIGKDLGRPKGQLIWADALYFKDLSKLPALLAGLGDERKAKAKCLKAMAVAAAYGYLDISLTLLDLTADRFTREERDALGEEIRRRGNQDLVPDFPGRARLARALYHVLRFLRPRRNNWLLTGSGQTLGNLE